MSAGSINANRNGGRPTVAVVLPGGGARGAYEIGALSVLLPALEARGERVSVWCGTSVGAINATTLAALAHLPAHEQTGRALAFWRAMRKRDVIAPLAGGGGARSMVRLFAHVLGVHRASVLSVFDPSPLAPSLDRWTDWRMLSRNVERGVVDSVCVVATSLASGGPVAFVSCRGGVPSHADEDLRYVKTRLRGEHVRASAAIPLMLPAVEVTTPRTARGHYVDGGTRLNSPIKPALHLGAERVIIVGLEPFAAAAPRASASEEPGIADVAANVLDGLLVDQVGNDLRRLAAINSFFAEDAAVGTSRAARAYRLARGHKPYRPISYALVAPRRRGDIGRLADEIFERRYGGLRGLRDPDYALMSRALGGRSRARGELLSFLMFDPEFTEALIEMAQRDAERWLRRHPSFWCRDAAHDLSVGRMDHGAVQEQETLDEFRSLRRR